MKKSFLLLTAGLLTGAAYAQEAAKSLMFQQNPVQVQNAIAEPANFVSVPGKSNTSTQRTTAGTGMRWYSYAGYQSQILTQSNVSAPYLWYDTTATVAYTGGVWAHNNHVATAVVLHPWADGFNDATLYPGEIALTNAQAYTVDSINIMGVYGRGTGTYAGTYVDTLIVTLTYGNGANTTNMPSYRFTNGNPPDVTKFPYTTYGVDTLSFVTMWHDSLRNRGTYVPTGDVGMASRVYKIPLGPSAVNDTNSLGWFDKTLAVGPMSVPAGNFAGATVTFRSGDPSYTTFDTVFRGTGGGTAPGGFYKHGMFRPYVLFNESGGTTQYPVYTKGDWNEGVFKIQPVNGWDSLYLPMYTFVSGTSASTLQYPGYALHVTCPACVLTGDPSLNVANVAKVTNVNAYPNPAANELNVPFTLSQSAAVTVSLTNVVGQVVATQNLGNVTNGKAVFNTSNLPSGVYVYTLEANGARTTGHVAIAH